MVHTNRAASAAVCLAASNDTAKRADGCTGPEEAHLTREFERVRQPKTSSFGVRRPAMTRLSSYPAPETYGRRGEKLSYLRSSRECRRHDGSDWKPSGWITVAPADARWRASGDGPRTWSPCLPSARTPGHSP